MLVQINQDMAVNPTLISSIRIINQSERKFNQKIKNNHRVVVSMQNGQEFYVPVDFEVICDLLAVAMIQTE